MFGDKLQRHERSFSEGDELFEEGDWGNAIFIIKNGKVEVTKENNGTEMHVAEIGSGEIVGEMVLGSANSIRTATVRAKTDVNGWKIRSGKVEELLGQSSDFREKFIRTITKRLQKTNEKLARKSEIERELYEISFLLLSMIDEEQWLGLDEEKKEFNMEKEPEFLAYQFCTSLEKIEDFLVAPTIQDLNRENDSQRKQKLIKIAMRILDEARKKIDINVPFLGIKQQTSEECVGNKILLRGIKKAKRDINKLKDSSYALDREDYRNIKSDIEELELVYDDLDESRKKQSFIVDHFKSQIEDLKERLSEHRLSPSES